MYIEVAFLSQLFNSTWHFLFKGCRHVETGEKVAESIRSCGITNGEVSCFMLDVGSFNSIKTFAELVLKNLPRIDLLVNNGKFPTWWSNRNLVVLEGLQVVWSTDIDFLHSLFAKSNRNGILCVCILYLKL